MLEQTGQLVNWSEIEALLKGLRSGTMGPPAYPSLAAPQ
jgi:hypothetical protein